MSNFKQQIRVRVNNLKIDITIPQTITVITGLSGSGNRVGIRCT